jgi:hypothetical protein
MVDMINGPEVKEFSFMGLMPEDALFKIAEIYIRRFPVYGCLSE